MSRVPSNKTEARRVTYKAGGGDDEGRRRREDDMQEDRKQGREDILQKKRGKASTSSQPEENRKKGREEILQKTRGESSTSSQPEENRKKGREEILQKTRGEASTSSATTQPVPDFSSMSSEMILESLPQMVAGIKSDDQTMQLDATSSLRELLSIEPNPPINEVIQSGVVPWIVQFLSRDNFSELQLVAAWALTNIASGTSESTQVIIDSGAVPLFVKLLSSASEDVREQAVFALGIVAGDSPKCRDIVLNCGAMDPVIEQFGRASNESMLKNATRTLSILCIGKPSAPFEQTRASLPTLALLLQTDDEVLTDACRALSYLSDGTNEQIQAVIDSGVVPRLVELLEHSWTMVQFLALRTIGNIVTGDDNQTQAVLDHEEVLPRLLQLLENTNEKSILKETCRIISNITDGNVNQIQAVLDHEKAFPTLLQLLENTDETSILEETCRIVSNITANQIQAVLDHEKALPRLLQLLENTDETSILKETCRIISNITAGNVNQIQEVIEAGIFRHLIHLLQQGEFEIKKEAVLAISNATSHGDHDQINFLESQGCFEPLCDFLRTCAPGELFRVTLTCLDKFDQAPVAVYRDLFENQADSDDPIYSKYIGSQVDLDDQRYECILHPRRLILKNLHAGTTESDIFSFFEDKASVRRVTLQKPQNDARTCYVQMKDLAETQKAMKMSGEVVRVEARPRYLGRHVFVERLRLDRRMLFVSNFEQGLGKKATRKSLQKILGRRAKIVRIFLPRDVEFGYILVEKLGPTFVEVLRQGSIKGIVVREAFLLPEFVDLLNSS